jgi:glycosyltransferase involved in cell wall biosynthesis
MKIVHISQYYNDGYGYQENLLPRYQAKLGHEVMVITSDRMSYFSGKKVPKIIGTGEFEDNGIRILRLPIKREFKGRNVKFSNLLETLDKEKPDYIFHHGLTSPSMKTVYKYKKKNPSTFFVTDNHCDLNICARNPLWRLTYYRLFSTLNIKKYLSSIDLVFGVTPARCYFAENELSIPGEIIRLLPIGADESGVKELLNKDMSIENERKNYRLQIVTGGKWFKGKGLAQLIDAVKDLNVNLKIFGKAEDEFSKYLLDNLPNNVSFEGWKNRKETFELLKKADIAIWPVRHTTLVEDAIATKTPLILRYHGSTSHFIRGNGIYLFTSESNEIRQSFELIARSKELLNDMKKNSEKQLDLLSYKKIAKESVDYYYDKSPKLTHKTFMNDALCNPNNRDFHKLS